MRGQSFRNRLMLGAVIWISIGVLVSGLVLSSLFRGLVTSQFDHDLSDHIVELEASIDADRAGALLIRRPLSDPRFEPRLSGVYWQALREDGAVLRSPSLDGRDLPLGGADAGRPRVAEGPTGPLRLLEASAPAPDRTSTLQIGVAVDQRLIDEAVARFDWTLVWSLGAMALGLIAAALAQVTFGLLPLARLRRDLTAVRTGAAPRLSGDTPLEVAPLVDDLNALIEANRDMVERARAQAGNLAHALKTPLALLAEQGRDLERDGRPDAGRTIMEQCARMQRQIDYQMARARAATRSTPGQATNVDAQARLIVAALSRLQAYRDIAFRIEGDASILVACDRDDLSEMLGNLLDNAAKWARGRVLLRIERAGPLVRIVVSDDGPGIPEDARERIFAIGERLDERKPGSGLGLAITRDLATLYGGKAFVGPSDSGASLILDLPAVRA